MKGAQTNIAAANTVSARTPFCNSPRFVAITSIVSCVGVSAPIPCSTPRLREDFRRQALPLGEAVSADRRRHADAAGKARLLAGSALLGLSVIALVVTRQAVLLVYGEPLAW